MYIRGRGLVGPWLIVLQRVDIRWTLSIEYVVLNKGPSYVRGCGLVSPCMSDWPATSCPKMDPL